MELAEEKSVKPTTEIEWLGFLVNSQEMTVTIPPKKLNDILIECQEWLQRPLATRKQIQSLAGKLSHISQVITQGRRFMGRILASLGSSPPTGLHPISHDFRADVKWFLQCAVGANCLRLINPTLPLIEIECDASKTGAGAFSPTTKMYYTTKHSPIITSSFHIHQLEALNAIMAVKSLIPPNTPPSKVIIKTDNSPSMFALNSGKTKDSVLSKCAREIYLFSAMFQHEVELLHAPGATLLLSDALSRLGTHPSFDTIANNMTYELGLQQIEPIPFDKLLSDI